MIWTVPVNVGSIFRRVVSAVTVTFKGTPGPVIEGADMANVREFGARGDGKADDSAAIQHAVQKGDGVVHFPRGDYLR